MNFICNSYFIKSNKNHHQRIIYLRINHRINITNYNKCAFYLNSFFDYNNFFYYNNTFYNNITNKCIYFLFIL